MSIETTCTYCDGRGERMLNQAGDWDPRPKREQHKPAPCRQCKGTGKNAEAALHRTTALVRSHLEKLEKAVGEGRWDDALVANTAVAEWQGTLWGLVLEVRAEAEGSGGTER